MWSKPVAAAVRSWDGASRAAPITNDYPPM